MLTSYRKLKLAIILYQANNAGGAWRSIMTYHRSAEMMSEPVKLINRSNRRTFRQVLAAAIAAPRLLFNGLDSFLRWEAIIVCLLRRDSLIYLHETAYMLDQFEKQSPFRFRLVGNILKRNPILAVSEQAAKQYRERFGSHNVFVAYECLPAPADISPRNDSKRICMVGTIDERKGASFFSRVADLASEKHLPWEFHWIGSKGSEESSYLSDNVTWWGWLDSPRGFVKNCDLFFLASVDDPFPLACLEALQDHVRAVAYTGTGAAEMIRDLAGCGVYSTYEAGDALEAIRSALAAGLDVVESDRLMAELIEVPAFQARMDTILSSLSRQTGKAGSPNPAPIA